MKNKTSTPNRLFSRFFSIVLLLAVSLAPAISPVVTAGEVIEPKAPPMFFMPPTTTTASNATPIVIGDTIQIRTRLPTRRILRLRARSERLRMSRSF